MNAPASSHAARVAGEAGTPPPASPVALSNSDGGFSFPAASPAPTGSAAEAMPAPLPALVAQRKEQRGRSPKPQVAGSNPAERATDQLWSPYRGERERYWR